LFATSAQDTEPYGLLLRNEARRIAQRPTAYILGEFLVADNTPCYFHDFIERAGKFELSYLCEGDLNSSIPQIRDPQTRRRNRELAGSDPLALEQYIDFFTGRTFRRSVLIRSQQAPHVKRARNVERLRSLNFASGIRIVASQSNEELLAYKDDLGRPFKTKDPFLRRTLYRLAECYPSTLTLKQLIEYGVQSDRHAEDDARVCSTLFALVVAGQVTASTLPAIAGHAHAEHPKVWSLARIEVAARQPWVTTLGHEPIPLRLVPVELISHLDGSNDRQALRAHIVRALKRGTIELPQLPAVRSLDSKRLEEAAERYLDSALSQLAVHALLEPTQIGASSAQGAS
jgi:methyltransferase-like protein